MSQTQASHIISAVDLAAGYGAKPLWQHASFAIQRGEFIGVLGPNGTGKTTLFKLILGLMKPVVGELHVFGSVPTRGNARIGYVPQRRSIDSDMRLEALELVRLGLRSTHWGVRWPGAAQRASAAAALQCVDGAELAHQPLGRLSGGELQRVFLAQALAGKPELLLLDEPLAHLDIKREGQFVNLLRDIATQQQIAMLLIAHDINPLLPAVDRIIYIANGKLATGTPRELVTSESLSAIYDAPVEVVRDSRGRLAVLGIREEVHHGG